MHELYRSLGIGPYWSARTQNHWMEVNQQINLILISVTITTLSSPFFVVDLLEYFPVQRCNSSGFGVRSAWVRWHTPRRVKISLLSKLLQSIQEREREEAEVVTNL